MSAPRKRMFTTFVLFALLGGSAGPALAGQGPEQGGPTAAARFKRFRIACPAGARHDRRSGRHVSLAREQGHARHNDVCRCDRHRGARSGRAAVHARDRPRRQRSGAFQGSSRRCRERLAGIHACRTRPTRHAAPPVGPAADARLEQRAGLQLLEGSRRARCIRHSNGRTP